MHQGKLIEGILVIRVGFDCADETVLCPVLQLKGLIENRDQRVPVVKRIERQDTKQTDDTSDQ